MQLQIQRLRPYATIPTQATTGSAGYDLYAALEAPVSIPVGEIVRIPTGIAAAPDRKDVALFIMAPDWLLNTASIWQTALGWSTATIGANCSFR